MATDAIGGGDVAGIIVGPVSTSKVGFYGATPVVRPSVYGAITDGSTGTLNIATGVAALTGTYNSTLLINALATLTGTVNSLRAALVAVGIVA